MARDFLRQIFHEFAGEARQRLLAPIYARTGIDSPLHVLEIASDDDCLAWAEHAERELNA